MRRIEVKDKDGNSRGTDPQNTLLLPSYPPEWSVLLYRAAPKSRTFHAFVPSVVFCHQTFAFLF